MPEARLAVAGEEVVLRPERAVWWPARRTLLVADLHIGKEAYFAAHGIAMPAAVLEDTLRRLDLLVEACGAQRIVVVGDLVHAAAGLTEVVRDRVTAWRRARALAIELVIGNHDRTVTLPREWEVRLREELERDGPFRYRHDPETLDRRPTPDDAFVWCGHLHPTIRLADHVDRLVLPCFALGERAGLLPAFTAFSRGVAVDPRAGWRAYAIAEGQVIPVRGAKSASHLA